MVVPHREKAIDLETVVGHAAALIVIRPPSLRSVGHSLGLTWGQLPANCPSTVSFCTDTTTDNTIVTYLPHIILP